MGHAIAGRLLDAGWRVEVTGRHAAHLDENLLAGGVTFRCSDRHDPAQLASAVGHGADLVVDCACFTAQHAREVAALLGDVTSMVMVSSKAVYVDDEGRHSNSDDAPVFVNPIREDQPTLAPGSGDFRSREGYGANKVAAERVLLDSGFPVSVVRASKVHGPHARRAREWYFVRRVFDGRRHVFFDSDQPAGDHPTAAANLAALIEHLATRPGARVLNCADPDAPTERAIARAVAGHFAHEWEEVVVEGVPGVGRSPWHVVPPIELDTSASRSLGYEPVGDYATTVAPTLEWLASLASSDATPWPGVPWDAGFFEDAFDYAAEDAILAR